MKKLAFLLALSFLLTGLASADIIQSDSVTVTYGQTFSIDYDDSTTPSYDAEMTMCSYTQEATLGSFGSDNFKVPQDFPCGYGEHTADVKVFNDQGQKIEDTTVNVFVKSKNMEKNPHFGNYLMLRANPDGSPSVIGDAFLTNDDWDYKSLDNGRNSGILIEDIDVLMNDEAIYNGTPGTMGVNDDDIGAITEGALKDEKEKYSIDGGGEPDGCVNDPCSVAKNTFSIYEYEFAAPATTSNSFGWRSTKHDSATPILNDEINVPQGPIKYGTYPTHYGGDAATGEPYSSPMKYAGEKGFFICREQGAQFNNGWNQQVPLVVNQSGQLYKCDQGTWKETTQCQDNLDNDGDGQIDEDGEGTLPPDSNCGGTSTKETGFSADCDPAKVYKDTDGTYYAYYEEDGSCVRENYTEWRYVQGGNPSQPHLQSDLDEPTCDYYEEPRGITASLDNPPECMPASDVESNQWAIDRSFNPDGTFTTMEMVHYGAERDYFDQLAEVRGRNLTTQGVTTEFVVDGTGWDVKTQPLHKAEMTYDAGQSSEIGGGRGFSHESSCEKCTNITWWDDLYMEGLDPGSDPRGYNDTSTAKMHQEAWVTGNAGETSSNILSRTRKPDQIFDGGWAGNCQSDRFWAYDDSSGRWECQAFKSGGAGGYSSSDVDNPTPVQGFDTSVYLPPPRESGGQMEVGMLQFPYIGMDSRPSYVAEELRPYPVVASEFGKDDQIQRVDAKCWSGSLSDMPSDCESSDRCVHKQADYSSSQPWGIKGTVSYDSFEDGYACRWAYITDLYNPGNPSGEPDAIVGGTGSTTAELHTDSGKTGYSSLWGHVKNNYGIKDEKSDLDLAFYS